MSKVQHHNENMHWHQPAKDLKYNMKQVAMMVKLYIAYQSFDKPMTHRHKLSKIHHDSLCQDLVILEFVVRFRMQGFGDLLFTIHNAGYHIPRLPNS